MTDVSRVLILFEIGFSLALTLATLATYFGRVGWSLGPRTLLLRKNVHIVLIAFTFFLLSAGAAVEIYGLLGEPVTWRSWYYGPTFLVASVAQLSLLAFERRAARG